MAKISVTLDGAVLQEIPLNKSKICIGRRPTNDVVLNHLAISGEHAVITTNTTTNSNDSFLEDRNSTNGTQVNGQPIKRHFLQHGDVITLAKYQIRYEADVAGHITHGQTGNKKKLTGQVAADLKPAFVKVLNGSNQGKQLSLSKEVTTLGTPGVLVATVTRINSDYLLRHVEGDHPTLINQQPIGRQAVELKQGDVIDLSGTQLVFGFNGI